MPKMDYSDEEAMSVKHTVPPGRLYYGLKKLHFLVRRKKKHLETELCSGAQTDPSRQRAG